jgi:uncharacterized protein YkwD
MMHSSRQAQWASALLMSLLLSACGGGGSDTAANSMPSAAAPPATVQAIAIPEPSAPEPNAPQATGDSATDIVNWFNFRRQQMGLSTLIRNSAINTAAQGHSNYQTFAGITHEQVEGNPGFTGTQLEDRLSAANYRFSAETGYAYGEVIVRTRNPSGFVGAEDLIAAIYHRFVIFEPMFKEVGSGAATAPNGSIYMTINFTVNDLTLMSGSGNFSVYPFANQQWVPRSFYSDSEVPDPVPSRNEVGYPISVHTDVTGTIEVQSFTVRARGGVELPVQLLTNAVDPKTPSSAASIVPLEPLAAATAYDVQFTGTVDGNSVNRSWSFTTQ